MCRAYNLPYFQKHCKGQFFGLQRAVCLSLFTQEKKCSLAKIGDFSNLADLGGSQFIVRSFLVNFHYYVVNMYAITELFPSKTRT